MTINILMPSLSPTMKEGKIAKWIKKTGDFVKSGDVIAEVETDKATMEIEVYDDGVIGKILFPEGSDKVKINTIIAVLLEDGESIEDNDTDTHTDGYILNKESTNKEKIIEESDKTIENNILFSKSKENVDFETKKHIFASPLARSLASHHNISLDKINGSGPYGRIIKNDIMALINTSVKDNNIVRSSKLHNIIPISNIRRVIATRLLHSKQTVPHFYLSTEVNMDKLISLRHEINELSKENNGCKISINDFIIKSSAKALSNISIINRSWNNDNIIEYNNIDISIAMSLEDGLVTPIIKNADQKNLIEISNEVKILAQKAQSNKLKPDEFEGGGFTISNLGMFDVHEFGAIINPPQSSILAVGAILQKPVVEDNNIKIGNTIKLTLSCDHRVIDGVIASKFLNCIKKHLENPLSLIKIS